MFQWSERDADPQADPAASIRRVFKQDGATWIDDLKLFGAYAEDDEEEDA